MGLPFFKDGNRVWNWLKASSLFEKSTSLGFSISSFRMEKILKWLLGQTQKLPLLGLVQSDRMFPERTENGAYFPLLIPSTCQLVDDADYDDEIGTRWPLAGIIAKLGKLVPAWPRLPFPSKCCTTVMTGEASIDWESYGFFTVCPLWSSYLEEIAVFQ